MAPPHVNGGRGACDAAPPPILLCLHASPGPRLNGGAAFSPPCSHGQGGAEAVAIVALAVLFG